MSKSKLPAKYVRAAAEARRFLASVDALEARVAADDSLVSTVTGVFYSGYGLRESGAVRRASLDLTRALADLRRP